jgi:class 3 adenylate cyclase
MATTATVTVLFCDVVGSTERLSRLGDDAGDEFRRSLFARLRACVDDAGGREVKNLGDGLMVVFQRSAIDALVCAQAMHREAAALDATDPV